MDYRWWAGHLMFTKAQVSALPILQLIFINFFVWYEGCYEWSVSVVLDFSLFPSLISPLPDERRAHTRFGPAGPHELLYTQVPEASGTAELGSCCSVAALMCNICKPLPCHDEQFPIYLVNSWAAFKVHYLNLEPSWDCPSAPLWCCSSIPYKDEPVTNYCSLVITPAWCNIWWHLHAGYKNRNTKYDLLQTIY